jgi:hypothetical protein
MERRSSQRQMEALKDDRALHLHSQDLLNTRGNSLTIQNNSYTDIVFWNEEGTHFTILDVERFEQEILPVYFRHRNFSSFVRQLNMYDFHKIRN